MGLQGFEDLLNNRTELGAEVMEALAEYTGLGLFNMDLASGDIKINRAGCLLTGFEPGEVPESDDTREKLIYEEDRDFVHQTMGRLFEGADDRYRIEYRMRRRDGSVVAVEEAAVVCARDKDGRPTHLALMGRDLTRLRWAEDKARQMEKELRQLARCTGEQGLADQNRMLRAANTAANMIIGGFHQDYETTLKAALQVIGESVLATRVRIWRNTELDGREAYFLRTTWTCGIDCGGAASDEPICYDDSIIGWQQLLRASHNRMLSAESITPAMREAFGIGEASGFLLAPLYLNGEFWGMLGVERDIEEHGFSEDEAEILINGVMVIASSISRNETFGKLNEARMAAMASTKAKGDFLSRMSHEIRTPINAIIGMTTIANSSNDPERVRYCLGKVEASSRQLLGLINDILDMSKIDSGKLEIYNSEFNFVRMLQNVVDVTEARLAEKGQQLLVDSDVDFSRLVVCDELRLTQVFTNLLTNASKFTPAGGKITVAIHELKRDGGTCLHVEVSDTGIGISQEKQERLFDAFEQGDGSITRTYGGSGLGLAICKRIVNLMGGDIWVESAEGEGSTFIFEVEMSWGGPLAASDAPGTSLSGEGGSGLGRAGGHDWAGKTLLLVEDIEVNREIVISILEDTGIEIISATNGQEALDLYMQAPKRYDAVLMDLQMPVMDGITATRRIRSLEGVPWAQSVPIIAMTANAFKEDALSCIAAGMDEHIAKPFDASDLVRKLAVYLGA